MQKVTFLGFGGGNALIPIIRKYAVLQKKWLSEEEFERCVIVTNLLPGPSVVETLAYVSITILGKFWGVLLTFIGTLPHVIFAFALLIAANQLPFAYVAVINVSVISAIIAVLFGFMWRYAKTSYKTLKLPIFLALFAFTTLFSIFVPAPYNIPAIVLVAVIFSVFMIEFIRAKKENKKRAET